jgi:hypothetical protein
LGGSAVNSAQGQGLWGLGWGFLRVRGRLGSGSRHVRLGMMFWMDEGSIWLRVKACLAWDEVLGG